MNTNVMTILDAKAMLEKMVAFIEKKQFNDFNPCRDEYLSAVERLRSQLGDEAIGKLLDAIDRRCEADMLFCGSLGYQANLANFRDPVARTFLDVDFEDYLRVHVLEDMPQRDAAECEIDEFFHSLNDEQKEIYEPISSYLVYLELDLTKLAHYYGFIFANQMLYYTEPGYHQNFCLSLRYQNFMEKWFSVPFDEVVKAVPIEEIEKIRMEQDKVVNQ